MKATSEALDWLENYLGHEPEAQEARRVARDEVAATEARLSALTEAATRAAAELRHAFRVHGLGQGPIDPNLVSRAIQILECATVLEAK